MIAVRWLPLLFGAALVWKGVQEYRLWTVARGSPTQLTCAELEQRGPGDNAHVAMRDFLLCTSAYVCELDKRGKRWRCVWIPAVPRGGAYHARLTTMLENARGAEVDIPPPDHVGVIVKTSLATSESAVDALADQDVLTGLVVNTIESLGGDERRLLAGSYPGVDLSRVWIVEHGRRPASLWSVVGLETGGLGLVALGVWWLSRRGFRAGRASEPQTLPQPPAPTDQDLLAGPLAPIEPPVRALVEGLRAAGLEGYYRGGWARHAAAAPLALEAIGAKESARIVREANALFPGEQPSREQAERVAALDAMPGRKRKQLARLGNELARDAEPLGELLGRWLVANKTTTDVVPRAPREEVG